MWRTTVQGYSSVIQLRDVVLSGSGSGFSLIMYHSTVPYVSYGTEQNSVYIFLFLLLLISFFLAWLTDR